MKHAIIGIITTIKDERNMKIHVLASVIVLFFILLFPLTTTEILFLVVCTGLVWAAEILNTAIENIVDLVSPDEHPLAKKAKDMAAGAVLTLSLTALLVFVIIVVSYI